YGGWALRDGRGYRARRRLGRRHPRRNLPRGSGRNDPARGPRRQRNEFLPPWRFSGVESRPTLSRRHRRALCQAIVRPRVPQPGHARRPRLAGFAEPLWGWGDRDAGHLAVFGRAHSTGRVTGPESWL